LELKVKMHFKNRAWIHLAQEGLMSANCERGNLRDISDSHGGEYEDDCLMGCCDL
jgi:hypothetical protein